VCLLSRRKAFFSACGPSSENRKERVTTCRADNEDEKRYK
jgi:hypothetical protein